MNVEKNNIFIKFIFYIVFLDLYSLWLVRGLLGGGIGIYLNVGNLKKKNRFGFK